VSSDLRRDLRSAANPESMCEMLRACCDRFGTLRSIDVLPLSHATPRAVACIIDMATAVEARAAQTGLGLAAFGTRSLVCVVESPGFSLAFPFRDVGGQQRAA